MVKSGTSTVNYEEYITDQNTFSGLTQEQKEARAEEAESFIKRLKVDLKTDGSISKEILFSKTKDIIYEWALALEELYYLGRYEKPLNTISSHIRKEIGKIEEIPLDKKEHVWDYMHKIVPDRFKLEKGPGSYRKNSDKNSSEPEKKLDEEGQFLLESILSLKNFYKTMVSITGTLANHMENPDINHDMKGYFDAYHKIAELRDIVDFMQGEGSILNQMMGELNIRQSATIFQKAMMRGFEAANSARQMAHYFSVVPRQNQRIRNRMEDWPKKDAVNVIRQNILSYCCRNPECGMHVFTGKRYSRNGFMLEEIKLSHRSYKIPEQYKGKPINPILIALNVAKSK